MKIEELASKLYQNVDSLDDIESDDVAEYLLDHYHIISKSTKCYKGEITLDGEKIRIGDIDIRIAEIHDGKYALLFIEGEKYE